MSISIQSPLLTIAIPTYKRASFLKELLEVLVPQLMEHAVRHGSHEVELLISNNCSPDETHEIIEGFKDRIPRLNYVRNAENIGSDNNFIQCFHLASGKYFYLIGDDDILLPGALPKLTALLRTHDPDIVYLSTSAFTNDYASQVRADPLNRGYRIIADARQFSALVNMMFVFISSIVVNRQRLQELNAPPIELARDSCLIQLSWTFPLLIHHRRSISVFDRLVAGRVDNGGYFNIATVSGVNLPKEACRLLGPNSPITDTLTSASLRRWFPTEIMALRRKRMDAELRSVQEILDPVHGRRWEYRIFTRPFFWLPQPLASLWLKATRLVNKIYYIANLPDFWRSRKDY